MTKEGVEHIIDRYLFLRQAIDAHLSEVAYYVGKRRSVDRITDDVKAVCGIIEEVYGVEKDEYIKAMIGGIMQGRTDVNIMADLPISRSSYYMNKIKFINKVVSCCASKGVITYNEILNERIA